MARLEPSLVAKTWKVFQRRAEFTKPEDFEEFADDCFRDELVPQPEMQIVTPPGSKAEIEEDDNDENTVVQEATNEEEETLFMDDTRVDLGESAASWERVYQGPRLDVNYSATAFRFEIDAIANKGLIPYAIYCVSNAVLQWLGAQTDHDAMD